MAQESFLEVGSEWVALSDKITVDADTTYYIQNVGPGTIVALESATEPAEDTKGGNIIEPYKQASYVKGTQDLYFRALYKNASINLTSKE